MISIIIDSGASLVTQTAKNLPVMQGMWVQSLGQGDPLGHGNPFQYSCLGNPTDRGACQATVHGVAKNQTQLKQWCTAHPQHTPCTLSLRQSNMIHSLSSNHTGSNSLNTVLSWLLDIKMETLSCPHHYMYTMLFYSFFITQYITYLFTVCLLSLYSNLNKTSPT